MTILISDWCPTADKLQWQRVSLGPEPTTTAVKLFSVFHIRQNHRFEHLNYGIAATQRASGSAVGSAHRAEPHLSNARLSTIDFLQRIFKIRVELNRDLIKYGMRTCDNCYFSFGLLQHTLPKTVWRFGMESTSVTTYDLCLSFGS